MQTPPAHRCQARPEPEEAPMPDRLRWIGAGSLACMVWLGACEPRFGDTRRRLRRLGLLRRRQGLHPVRSARSDHARQCRGPGDPVAAPGGRSRPDGRVPGPGRLGLPEGDADPYRRRTLRSQRCRSGRGLRSGHRRDPLDPAAVPADDRGSPGPVLTGDGLLDRRLRPPPDPRAWRPSLRPRPGNRPRPSRFRRRRQGRPGSRPRPSGSVGAPAPSS